tara:strand:- start:36 stop:497 length:462 start_codon:yes stop_codon:yes gene_type:complete
MKKIFIDYGNRINHAILNVIKDILNDLSESKISSNHCFYITFKTKYEGVQISRSLLKEYPEEMTVVLQNQFWDLSIKKNEFSVTLSFNKKRETLVIPFNSIVKFYDPFVKFSIQLELRKELSERQNEKRKINKENKVKESKKILTLDDFRKST